MTLSRRDFIGVIALSGTFSLVPNKMAWSSEILPKKALEKKLKTKPFQFPSRKTLDLSPAKWIWYPGERVLPNSFFHFRKSFQISENIKSAKGWILGDSRYLLFVNGQRIQFGPSPSDPRFTEADPMDLGGILNSGENVIGATVLYYGFGDGAWPAGKAGFIFNLKIEYVGGREESIVSDHNWQVQVAKSWPLGKYKRWYLRSLQEVFDNRIYPEGWYSPGFELDESWFFTEEMVGDSAKTALSTSITDYMYDSGGNQNTQLRRRIVPLIKEMDAGSPSLREAHIITWKVPVEEYFDLKTKEAFRWKENIHYGSPEQDTWTFGSSKAKNEGIVLSFEWEEQMVGWPYFTVECAEGTTIELMVQQSHRTVGEGGPPLTNNNFNSWTRFICKEGMNTLITFDYESVKWIQLHLHQCNGPITITKVGFLRRVYDFPDQAEVSTSSPNYNKVLLACINTVYNNSHETIVDCVGRERQQYSGDIGHMLHALHAGFGERLLPYRYVDTYSQGLTLEGYFMDSWPAYDRLNRIAQRQLDLTPWGILLDHSIGFCFDCWYHYLYSGRLQDLEEAFPRLMVFYEFLKKSIQEDGLLPVENLGIAAVWMDTDAYKSNRDKQCAFNLYAASMFKLALAPLAREFGLAAEAKEMEGLSEQLSRRVKAVFWDALQNILIINLPWHQEDGEKRTCERSLAHYVLGDFMLTSEAPALLKELTERPQRLGRCYPANAIWPYWALTRLGDTSPMLMDFQNRWFQMLSVQENNTIQEQWHAVPDSQNQFSHAGIAPFFAAYMCLAGIEVIEPGAKTVHIRPQMGNLEKLKLTYRTALGPIRFKAEGKSGRRNLDLERPEEMRVLLIVSEKETSPKNAIEVESPYINCKAFDLSHLKSWSIPLKHT
ncbi:alpha-L-rhamnosidase-related protein [Pararhodonellum marinum]|uniref:alpha-L-rhamnosidase-related protein n=1 Tax=Pararhodonellum marinum TaxID=2755358 RepID=UPI00188E64E9|nr:alpha-L-rhamnosidase N-terminal domain-containing protein [Pararhodonellum marinum]